MVAGTGGPFLEDEVPMVVTGPPPDVAGGAGFGGRGGGPWSHWPVAITALLVAFTLAAGLIGFRLGTIDARSDGDEAGSDVGVSRDPADSTPTTEASDATDSTARPRPTSTAPTATDSDTTASPTTTVAPPEETPPPTAPVTTAPPPPPSSETTAEPVPVTEPLTPLQLANPGSQTSRVGRWVELALTVTGGTGEGLVFSAEGLPEGLGIDPSSGVVSGVPFDRETASVQVSVTDSSGTSHNQGFTWVVEGRWWDR